MSSGVKDGIRKRANYRYNGLGQRVGQRVYENDNMNPEKEMQYTIDITRQYHNLLNLKDNITDKDQTYYWDMNVAVMEENEAYSYYIQDDLGSPMQLVDEGGLIMETYGFDEFGMELSTDNFPEANSQNYISAITGLHNNKLQPFGFTGYQMDEAGEMYFAQARRYDAEAGRFVSEDKIAGFTDMPFTLNRYSYCWNRPVDYVDLDGNTPWLIFILIALGLSGCTNTEEYDVNLEMPQPGTHEYKHSPKLYNSGEYKSRTNCYAYAFDLINNPITGDDFYSRIEASLWGQTYAAQPGMFSGYYSSSDYTIFDGTEESNMRLVEYVKADCDRLGLDFKEYEVGMEGGYAVLLVVKPGSDYHWYRQDVDGTWSHKQGTKKVITGVKDPVMDAIDNKYTSFVHRTPPLHNNTLAS